MVRGSRIENHEHGGAPIRPMYTNKLIILLHVQAFLTLDYSADKSPSWSPSGALTACNIHRFAFGSSFHNETPPHLEYSSQAVPLETAINVQ